MANVALKAYAALSDVPPIDKIVLYEQYDFPREYLLDPFWQICTRSKSLSVEEAQVVGLETLALIGKRSQSGTTVLLPQRSS